MKIRKRILSIISIFLFALLLVACGDKGNTKKVAPVYQGMVVSKSVETLSHYSSNKALLSTTTEDIDQDDPFDNFDDSTIEDEIKKDLEVVTNDEVEYFVEKDETFYITVKLLNPDNFEILSFTLNGTFYQSYEFEYGSDSENLILKAKSDDISGIKEYTIDTIKYIDRTEIKDVIFAGDRTIKVGVEYDVTPYSRVTNLDIDTTTVSLNVEIADPAKLIEINESKVSIYLYNGVDIVDKKDLVVGNNKVMFEKLDQDTLYQYAIVTSYDKLDRKGNQVVTLEKLAFYTNKILDVEITSEDKTSFSFKIDDKIELGEIESIELFKDGKLVESLRDLTIREFKGLLSNNDYELKVTYSYDLNDGKGVKTTTVIKDIKTLALEIPSVEIIDILETQESVSFDLDIKDTDQVGEIESIELYLNDNNVATLESFDVLEFSDLLSNNLYEIRVVYSYDLNDGEGTQELKVTKTFTTIADPIEITGIIVLNSVNLKTGEEVQIRVHYNNPSKLNIKAFYVNDEKVLLSTTNTATNAIFKFVPDFEGGIYEVNITGFEYESFGVTKSITIENNITYSILIMGSIGIESINEENNNSYIVENKDNYLNVEINNPTGYQVTKLVINDMEYLQNEINMIDNNLLRVKVKGYISDSNNYEVKSITYGMEGYEFTTKTISGINVTLYGVYSDEIRYISTIEELQNLVDGYVYELTNDINADGFKWVPYEFRGVLLGNNYVISNLSIVIENESENEQYYGLFSKLSSGLIDSLGLVDAYILIKTLGQVNVGGLVGETYSGISNSYISGSTITVTSESNAYVGGLVGRSDRYSGSIISNSYVSETTITVTTKSYSNVGGLVGSSSSISNSYVSGTTITVTSESRASVGGLVGESNSSISNSYVSGSTITVTTESSSNVGGLVGESYSSISNSYISGTTITVTSSYAYVGGLVGNSRSISNYSYSSISNSYVSGTTITVTAKSDANVGGLVGSSSSSSSISNSYVSETTITVTSESLAYVGGLVGYSDSTSNSYVTFDVTIKVNDIVQNVNDELIEIEELDNKNFYIDVLGWNESVWNFDDLDYNNNKYPTLKQ